MSQVVISGKDLLINSDRTLNLSGNNYIHHRNNKRNLSYIVDEDIDHKIQSLLPDRDISDPWYSDNFELAFNDIMEGCKLRFEEIFE